MHRHRSRLSPGCRGHSRRGERPSRRSIFAGRTRRTHRRSAGESRALQRPCRGGARNDREEIFGQGLRSRSEGAHRASSCRQSNRTLRNPAAGARMIASGRIALQTGGAALVVLAWSLLAAAEPPVKLMIPLNCQLNVDCFVQNYVDHDPGKGAEDYTCGSETYDGQDGTDFRVPDLSAKRDLRVRAVAAGRVLRVRDGMPDISIRRTGEQAVSGKECGNGVVIDQGGGWETQYCHLAKDSVSVRRGDTIAAGQAIGRVGLSGLTEFPHVHVTVRFKGEKIDPFAFGWEAGHCSSGTVLWDLPAGWSYPKNFVIATGFTDRTITIDDVSLVGFGHFSLTADTPALLAAAIVGGVSEGAFLEMTLVGPNG